MPGRELWVADTLSRQLSTTSCKPCPLAIKLAEQTLVTNLAMAPGQLRELHEASAEDLELQADRLAIKTGD